MERDDSSDAEMSSPTTQAPGTSAGSTTCPTCGRSVETGFKFCDFCGTKLETEPTKPEPAGTQPAKSESAKPESVKPNVEKRRPREEKRSFFGRLRRREADDAASALAAGMTPADQAPPLGPPPRGVPTPPAPQRPAANVPTPPPPPVIEPPPPRPEVPPRPTSQMTKAEDLRAATSEGRAGISGRLRWRADDTVEAKAPDATRAEEIKATWRAVPSPAAAAAPVRGFSTRDGFVFAAHLLIAFAVGALLVGIAAVVASLMSDGRVALLEVRGLPVFIAGASAIIVFALLRTGPRNRLSSRAVAITVLVGFVVIVVGVALGYQPALMRNAQSELDSVLGVFGDDVLEGIDRFEADVDQWNAEVHQYSEVELSKLSKARDTEADAAKLAKTEESFRIAASGSEEALDGILKRMRSHADGVGHAPLREALTDLTGIFADELSGIHLITRGFVNDDQALIQSGDTRFKDATQRAVEFYDERVRPILERGDIDADSLGLAVEDLRG
jgi:hypothetical protein